jgi:hypothetical protein
MKSELEEEIREGLEQLPPHELTKMRGYVIILKACLKFHTHPPKDDDNLFLQLFYFLIGAAHGARLDISKGIRSHWENLCLAWVIVNWLHDNQ